MDKDFIIENKINALLKQAYKEYDIYLYEYCAEIDKSDLVGLLVNKMNFDGIKSDKIKFALVYKYCQYAIAKLLNLNNKQLSNIMESFYSDFRNNKIYNFSYIEDDIKNYIKICNHNYFVFKVFATLYMSVKSGRNLFNKKFIEPNPIQNVNLDKTSFAYLDENFIINYAEIKHNLNDSSISKNDIIELFELFEDCRYNARYDLDGALKDFQKKFQKNTNKILIEFYMNMINSNIWNKTNKEFTSYLDRINTPLSAYTDIEFPEFEKIYNLLKNIIPFNKTALEDFQKLRIIENFIEDNSNSENKESLIATKLEDLGFIEYDDLGGVALNTLLNKHGTKKL